MNEPKNELVPKSESPTQTQMVAMIQVIERAAANPDVDVDKMERLLAMQERIMERNAKSEFDDAMKAVQAEVPRILRDAKNDSTNSSYARLETVIIAITPIYTKHGFSLSFGTDVSHLEGHYRVICDVSHTGGHTKRYSADVPADTTGMKGTPNKTATHGFGSTMSYGRRYITLMIFNLALVNEDDDGVAGGAGPRLDETQVADLKAKIEEVSADPVAFFAHLSRTGKVTISKAEDVPVKMFKEAIALLTHYGKKKVAK